MKCGEESGEADTIERRDMQLQLWGWMVAKAACIMGDGFEKLERLRWGFVGMVIVRYIWNGDGSIVCVSWVFTSALCTLLGLASLVSDSCRCG